MRNLLYVFTLVAILSLVFGGVALAEPGSPVGGRPDSFELHAMHAMGTATQCTIIRRQRRRPEWRRLPVQACGRDGKNHVHVDNTVPCAPKPERCVVVAH